MKNTKKVKVPNEDKYVLFCTKCNGGIMELSSKDDKYHPYSPYECYGIGWKCPECENVEIEKIDLYSFLVSASVEQSISDMEVAEHEAWGI